MKKKDEKLFRKIIEELQKVWSDNNLKFLAMHRQSTGIRSSQVGALVCLLIKKGIIKDE